MRKNQREKDSEKKEFLRKVKISFLKFLALIQFCIFARWNCHFGRRLSLPKSARSLEHVCLISSWLGKRELGTVRAPNVIVADKHKLIPFGRT